MWVVRLQGSMIWAFCYMISMTFSHRYQEKKNHFVVPVVNISMAFALNSFYGMVVFFTLQRQHPHRDRCLCRPLLQALQDCLWEQHRRRDRCRHHRHWRRCPPPRLFGLRQGERPVLEPGDFRRRGLRRATLIITGNIWRTPASINAFANSHFDVIKFKWHY